MELRHCDRFPSTLAVGTDLSALEGGTDKGGQFLNPVGERDWATSPS
ncbi:hypothetical protein [Rubrivirga sp.]